jgi:RimJ/RimL family protein N-acetyltransferase
MALAFPDPPLAADGVVLRPLAETDAPWIVAACDSEEMARWLPHIPSPYREQDALDFIRRAGLVWKDGTHAPFAVADESGAGLGAIELRFFPGDREIAELGYWLRPQMRRHGVMTTAVLLVARWAFGSLGVRRLQVTADPENLASQRVAERAGFSREGLLRSWIATPMRRRDALIFSLLREELPR